MIDEEGEESTTEVQPPAKKVEVEVNLADGTSKKEVEETLGDLSKLIKIDYLLLKNHAGGLGNCLKHAKGLKTLALVNCELEDRETVELMKYLESSTVEVFSVSKPFRLLDTGGIAALCRMLRNAQHLNAIHLPIEWICPLKYGAICEAIAESAIETLALSISLQCAIEGSSFLRELGRARADVGTQCRLRAVKILGSSASELDWLASVRPENGSARDAN